MNINWKVRMKNKAFWIALIPALLLLLQTIGACVGVELEIAEAQEKLLALINALFAVLAIVGVVADPTTPGIYDSDRALGYDEPGHQREE